MIILLYNVFEIIEKKGVMYINTGKSTNSNGYKNIILKQKHCILLTYSDNKLGYIMYKVTSLTFK